MKRIKNVRTRLIKQYILAVILTTIFTILLFVVFDSHLYSSVSNYIYNNYSMIAATSLEFMYYSYILPLGVYLALLFVVTLIFFFRTAGYVDKGYNAISHILDENYETPRLPNAMRKTHQRVESSITTALRYREYVAKEAEQRKNDLVVYLAHDLKTPLTSIIGYLTLLEESPELPLEYRAKYTNITLEKAYRLEQLINEFFDITLFNLQGIVLDSNHIDIVMMLQQMAEEFYPVLKEKNLTCSVTANEKINVIGDADKLSRVFDNLMRNAVSYSYSNTNINISAYIENNKAVVKFKNSGDKISPEKLELVFEKFFRVDSSRASSTGGSGLGLAIAKEIVEKHGGSITADSNDYFTTFTVTLKL